MRIAIKVDTNQKHDLCESDPCTECADYAYRVMLNDKIVDTYYGIDIRMPDGNKQYFVSLNNAINLATLVKAISVNKTVRIQMFDLNSEDGMDSPTAQYDVTVDGLLLSRGE